MRRYKILMLVILMSFATSLHAKSEDVDDKEWRTMQSEKVRKVKKAPAHKKPPETAPSTQPITETAPTTQPTQTVPSAAPMVPTAEPIKTPNINLALPPPTETSPTTQPMPQVLPAIPSENFPISSPESKPVN